MICADVKMIRLDVKVTRHFQKSRKVEGEFVTHSRLSHTHRSFYTLTHTLVRTEPTQRLVTHRNQRLSSART